MISTINAVIQHIGGIVNKATNNIVKTCGYCSGLDKGIGELGLCFIYYN
ncbi:hypothetical protein [Flavobacterium urumqiense]|nr:hypothetical protein [Flavobacterium urumqiense]